MTSTSSTTPPVPGVSTTTSDRPPRRLLRRFAWPVIVGALLAWHTCGMIELRQDVNALEEHGARPLP